jgi:hypothetical protein
VHTFTRKEALLYILDQLHLQDVADLEASRRHQLAQRASDPTWVILQKAADRQHWVISVEDGVTSQDMGNLLMGVLNDPPPSGIPNWSNVEDMATAVADFLHRHVQVLRGSALGHTHTGVTAFGRWDDVDNPPICLLLWNDLLWRCEATGPPPQLVAHDLPSFVESRDAAACGLVHTMGVLAQGQAGVTDLSTVAAVWQTLQGAIPHTRTSRSDYALVAVSTNVKAYGMCRLDTLHLLSKRSDDQGAMVRICKQGYSTHALAITAMEHKLMKLFNQRQTGTMIHIMLPQESVDGLQHGINMADVKEAPRLGPSVVLVEGRPHRFAMMVVANDKTGTHDRANPGHHVAAHG